MNLKQALYIQTIAREGGITAAARKLYVSQPSLSQMLRQIEEEVGLPLFDRSLSPLKPTYAGERYLHAARQMLAAQEELDWELQQIRRESAGRLRLGISMQRAAQLLPRVLPRFVRDYPQVHLELKEGGSSMLEQMALDGQVDLALASTQADIPDLHYELLQREEVGILAGEDSPLAGRLPSGSAITLKEALEAPLVALKPGHNVRLIQDRLFQTLGRQPDLFLETDSMETARQLTLACGCYMLCTSSHAGGEGAFYPLLDYENCRHFYACRRGGQSIPRYMEDFLGLVREMLAD